MTTPAIQPALLPVLLIEDEPSIMALVSATLERNGYEVVCIESGAEALRMLEKGQFLGVVSDMRTPGGVDGAQVHTCLLYTSLAQLAREIDGLLHLPDFARKFVERSSELAGARAGAVALFQDGKFQTLALHPLPTPAPNTTDPVPARFEDRALQQRFACLLYTSPDSIPPPFRIPLVSSSLVAGYPFSP